MTKDDLWQAYQDICIRPRDVRLPVHNCAIITAHNPASRPQQPAQNDDAQARLVGRLHALGLHWSPALVGNRDFSYSEPSLAVSIGRAEAVALGIEFGQNAIYWIDRGQLYLLPCLLQAFECVKLGPVANFVTTVDD